MLETNTRQGTFTTLKECMNAIEPSCAWIQKQQNSEHWFHANGINCPSKILKQWPPSRQKNAMTRALSRGGGSLLQGKCLPAGVENAEGPPRRGGGACRGGGGMVWQKNAHMKTKCTWNVCCESQCGKFLSIHPPTPVKITFGITPHPFSKFSDHLMTIWVEKSAKSQDRKFFSIRLGKIFPSRLGKIFPSGRKVSFRGWGGVSHLGGEDPHIFSRTPTFKHPQ